MTPHKTLRGAAVDIKRATKTYGAFLALDDISLTVRPGEFMTFLGPSGSGKTTTLNVVAGFAELSAGSLEVDGRPMAGVPAHKREIGVVFQHYALFPHMTVAKNVAYPLTLRGVSGAARAARVARALDMVKMADIGHRYPSELSGGQQQRVALARAIVFDPALLLMDEPLGALDKKLREWLQLEIKRIHRELGTTFIYVTHDQEEALVLSDRIAVFNKGHIQQIGTGRDLYDDPATLFVARFIGESTVLRGTARRDGSGAALDLAGETVTARAAGAGAGDARGAALLVRPEKLRIRPVGAPWPEGENRLSGTVSEAIYLGSASKYEVRLRDGSTAIVRQPIDERTFAIGEAVELRFHPSDAKLLADDAEADATPA